MMGAGDQQQASRGSSVLVDNIRWQSYLSSMTSAEAEEWGVDDDQRRFFVRFGVSKANYGAPFADRWFRRHDGGVLKPAVLERQRKSKGCPVVKPKNKAQPQPRPARPGALSGPRPVPCPQAGRAQAQQAGRDV